MALTPVRETVGAVRDVFLKVFELYTGGFSINTAGFNKGVKLPKGSLLKVDESTRLAAPIKTAVLTATADQGASSFAVEPGHHFKVSDHVGLAGGGSAHRVKAITSTIIRIDSAAGKNLGATAGIGAVLYHAAGTADAGAAAMKDVPNGILRYDTHIATGEFATVALRGSVYKERIQAHIAGHLANLKHIHFSESK